MSLSGPTLLTRGVPFRTTVALAQVPLIGVAVAVRMLGLISLLVLALVGKSSGFTAGTRVGVSWPKLLGQRVIQRERQASLRLFASTEEKIVSPFDASKGGTADDDDDDDEDEDELPLTRENVELVLDEMRPYLQSDGGDVKLSEIDGPIVRLELVGACGTCPSSSMTMKMGLERKLKERIPEIAEVVQTLPQAPALTNENIETVLDGVRPFLAVAGGKISIDSITGAGGLQPCVTLKMEGSAASLQSVKLEIMQRIQRHFMVSLRIEWK